MTTKPIVPEVVSPIDLVKAIHERLMEKRFENLYNEALSNAYDVADDIVIQELQRLIKEAQERILGDKEAE